MNLGDYASLAGILSIIVAGANFIVMVVAKTFWNLTFKRKEEDDENRFKKIERSIEDVKLEVKSHEEKNKYFRHNFDSVTKGLEAYISSEIKHLGELLGLQIKNIVEKINDKENKK